MSSAFFRWGNLRKTLPQRSSIPTWHYKPGPELLAPQRGRYKDKREKRCSYQSLVCRRRRRRSGWGRNELGVVDWNVLLQVIDLDSETVSGTGNRPAVRRLYAVSRAVVVVVDLRGIVAERRIRITNQANQQVGFLIQVKSQRRLTLVVADHQPGVVAVDFFTGQRFPF